MQLAKVIGTIVSTQKDKSIDGLKIMVIQPLTDTLKPSGNPIAAIDTVQAGTGDIVHWVTAREAALTLSDTFSPIDAAITGIIDQINIDTDKIKDKQSIFG